MNDNQKEALEAIAFWAEVALEGAKGALKEGKADAYDLFTFRSAARGIKAYRRVYIEWENHCKNLDKEVSNE